MKTFVIAQHHGVFLTLQSMKDCGIDNIIIIIPSSQVNKYNNMHSERSHDPEFQAFKDYDKKISEFVKSNDLDAKVFVFDDFDIRNTVTSTLKFIDAFGCKEIAVCVLSGAVILKDYRQDIKGDMMQKTFGACLSRVYQSYPPLCMYHMLGLPQVDKSIDVNFFAIDMTKITPNFINMTDGEFLNLLAKNKQLNHIPRDYNGKDDVLIGTAISARQTITHNLKIQSGYIANLWNKSIRPNDMLKSEEIYGYPLNIYGKYVRQVRNYLPKSTVSKIIANGDETEKVTSGLYECLDIIDL